MKNVVAICLLSPFCLAAYVLANPDAGFPRSPEVHADGRVTFRLLAPGAEKVVVKSAAVGKGGVMGQGEGGLWELTTGPVAPGIYSYSFRVDGVFTLDPHNRSFKKWRRSENQFLVPGNPPLIFEPQEVPRGTVHRHFYHSQLLGEEREVFVYTPPGYSKGGGELPVLFLLHGSGDDASAWTEVGRAHVMADNLIAAGEMGEMVIVMPYGHGSRPGVDLRELADRERWHRENSEAVEASFFGEVLPFVSGRYRVSDDPAKRAIAGLSMGGGQALQFGLLHPEQFAWVCGFSSGVPGSVEEMEALEAEGAVFDPLAERRLVWIACGKDDFLLGRNHFFRGWLTEQGVKHEWHLTEGGHSWPVWRGYLEEVLPMLFR